MLDATFQLGLFAAKAVIIVLMILFLLTGIILIISRGKEKLKGQIAIKHLNKKYQDTQDLLSHEILPKDQYKQFLKDKKAIEKAEKAKQVDKKTIFVINFYGDTKASAVASLREEITAILNVAKPHDEVVVCLESGGGMLHAYGLAAAQLKRIRQKNICLTVIVDKVAASGGYLMACLASKILAAPFSIIGSIGVLVQVPNFHRLLKEKHIDFEQLTAGNFKRTISLFGENTKEGKEKLQHEIEEAHRLFKLVIQEHRSNLDIEKVSTGETWLGCQAIDLKLVDELTTSDDYLLSQSEQANIYEITYQTKKSFAEKLVAKANAWFKPAFSHY